MLRTSLVLLLTLTAAACTGDDGGSTAIDAAPGQDAPVCILPATTITCTDDTVCQSSCGQAYCYLFNQVGMVCTQPCTVVGDCPTGWSCNNMGRCRPPG